MGGSFLGIFNTGSTLHDYYPYYSIRSSILGFDHGVGHSLLLLSDAKASHAQKSKEFNGLGHYPSNISIRLLQTTTKRIIHTTIWFACFSCKLLKWNAFVSDWNTIGCSDKNCQNTWHKPSWLIAYHDMPASDAVGWCWVAESGRRHDRGRHISPKQQHVDNRCS